MNDNLRSAVFLDRDGVLNLSLVKDGKPHPPNQISEVRILGGVINGVNLLREHGFEIVVITNQPDVARGVTSELNIKKINTYLGNEIGIEHFYICFHDDMDACECRKPKAGLLRLAARELKLDLDSSFMVGDRWRDIEAGQSAGCTCYFIDYSYHEKRPSKPFFPVNSLHEAAIEIVRNMKHANIE